MKSLKMVFLFMFIGMLTACGGGGGSEPTVDNTSFTVSTNTGVGGVISPTSTLVNLNDTTSFTVTADKGYSIDSVSGCNGLLSGSTYTTGAITADCTVSASFSLNNYTVNTIVGVGGTINPTSAIVEHGATTSFTVTVDSSDYEINSVSGCNGLLSGSTYTTGAITTNCTVSVTFNSIPSSAATPNLTFSSVKNFHFSWTDVSDATHYKLLENPDGTSGFTQVGSDIPKGTQSIDHIVPLYARINAQYILQSCNAVGCTDSSNILVSGSLAAGIGYVKASNTETLDFYGNAVSLSEDGNTLAVGAADEDSDDIGVSNNEIGTGTLVYSGAVYVFTRNGAEWLQQAYIKASNTGAYDKFGYAVSLSGDGNTLAVGAPSEASNATGVNQNESDDSLLNSGAVYVFTRTSDNWSQQAYIKASNTGTTDRFGTSVSLSGDGNILAVGAENEESDDTGVSTNEVGTGTLLKSGAVYVFTRTSDNWSQNAYIKASNTGAEDNFGSVVSLSADGSTLAVGAQYEDSNATLINGDENDNSASGSGAVYVFSRTVTSWLQQAYIKASNTSAYDNFGHAVSLSGDGNTLAVSAPSEASNATGVNQNESDNSADDSGAVYIFTRTKLFGWGKSAYLKASNTGFRDLFGITISLSNDGKTLAVGAVREDSASIGIDGDQGDSGVDYDSGAVYVFSNSGLWNQQAYVKASNTDAGDFYGVAVSLSGDGNTLAVGATNEDSSAVGVNGDQGNNLSSVSGAVYLY